MRLHEEATHRDMDVLAKHLARQFLHPCCHMILLVEAGEDDLQPLPQMADHDLQPRVPIECACHHQPQDVDCCVGMPSPARDRHPEAERLWKTAIERLARRRGRDARMNIDRYPQPCGSVQQHVIARMIKVPAVGGASHQSAFESQLLDAPFELVCGGIGISKR